jgi:hypothetical protein
MVSRLKLMNNQNSLGLEIHEGLPLVRFIQSTQNDVRFNPFQKDTG